MIFDVHVHSHFSPCSDMSLADILSLSRRRGLDGVCITDHDTMRAARHIREGIQEDGLCVVVGMEYATPQGDFLIFGPFEGLSPGLDALPLLSLVEESGGAAVAAHPFRPGRSVKHDAFESGLCRLVEESNGRNPATANDRAAEMVRSLGLTGLGGSDAHSVDELGRVTTRMHARIEGRRDFINALRLGRCSLASIAAKTGADMVRRLPQVAGLPLTCCQTG